MPVAPPTIYAHCTGANSVTTSMTHDLRMKSDEVQFNQTTFSYFLSGWTVPLNNSVEHTDECKTEIYCAITAVDFFSSKP